MIVLRDKTFAWANYKKLLSTEDGKFKGMINGLVKTNSQVKSVLSNPNITNRERNIVEKTVKNREKFINKKTGKDIAGEVGDRHIDWFGKKNRELHQNTPTVSEVKERYYAPKPRRSSGSILFDLIDDIKYNRYLRKLDKAKKVHGALS